MSITPGVVWPGWAAAAADPTAVYTASTRALETDDHERVLHLSAVVAGAVPRAIQLQVATSYDGGVQYVVTATKTIQTNATGTYQAELALPPHATCLIWARRWGGDATTTLIVRAQARAEIGCLLADGQPLELAAHQVEGIECWGDGAGAAVNPGLAFAGSPAAPLPWIPVGEATHLEIDSVIAGVAATTIEYEVRQTHDDAATTLDQPIVGSVSGGVVSTVVKQESVDGAVGQVPTRLIPVVPGTSIVILAKRTGGAVGTLLIARARLFALPVSADGGGGGVGGGMAVVGNVAHDAVDAGNPVKIGLRAEATIIAAVADGDRVDAIGDLHGRQVVRDGIAGDDVAGANRGSVNTMADDRDEDGAPQIWANETNTGAGTSYYPSANGEPVANNSRMGFEIQATDATLYLQHSLTGGAGPWFDVTVMVRNNVNGGAGFPSFASVGASTNFNLSILGLDGGYFRWAVVYPDGSNALIIKKAGKAV